MKPWPSAWLCLAMACASTGRPADSASHPPDTPGGECSWSVREGGAECAVFYGGEVRSRKPGTTGGADVQVVYFDWFGKWKCGEKRQVCGGTVECTCPYPVSSDGERSSRGSVPSTAPQPSRASE